MYEKVTEQLTVACSAYPKVRARVQIPCTHMKSEAWRAQLLPQQYRMDTGAHWKLSWQLQRQRASQLPVQCNNPSQSNDLTGSRGNHQRSRSSVCRLTQACTQQQIRDHTTQIHTQEQKSIPHRIIHFLCGQMIIKKSPYYLMSLKSRTTFQVN